MNREIKFRAWTGEVMQYNVMTGWLGGFYVQGIDAKDSASMSPFNTKYGDHVPIMQFTGLLDKNGKEIFEGDMVEYVDTYDGQITSIDKYIVEFAGGGFYLKSVEDEEYNSDINISPVEIIGNIYENPELLNN